MNQSITFTGDWALHGIMSDLGVDFALSPFHRIGFEIDDAGSRRSPSATTIAFSARGNGSITRS